ncbi:MAG: type II toxin-antitoxin system ParD family antitoxin [Allosphingosinicella sp.]
MNDQPPRRLARHFEVFIEDQIEQRKYKNSTEVIEDALRLLEAREGALDRLRRAVAKSEASGEAAPFDMDAWLEEQERLDSAA